MAFNAQGSFSFLANNSPTQVPGEGLLKVGEPFANTADGTLWVGTDSAIPLEIGLNAKSGKIADTGKYLRKNVDLTTIVLPYNPLNLRIQEYFEFFVYFTIDTVNPSPTYSPVAVNWGAITDPLPLLTAGSSILVKFFAYGYSNQWNALPVWSNDAGLDLFNGGLGYSDYYNQVLDATNTYVPQRRELKFQTLGSGGGVNVIDDSGNDRTIVEIDFTGVVGTGGGSGAAYEAVERTEGASFMLGATEEARQFITPTANITVSMPTTGIDNTTYFLIVNDDPDNFTITVDTGTTSIDLDTANGLNNVNIAYTGTSWKLWA